MRIIFLLLCGGPLIAAAQSAPPTQLSLAQAIELAQTHQGAFRNLALDRRVAAQATRATRGAYGPQLGAAADLRYNAILPTNIIPNFANLASGERVAVRFGTKWQASAGLTLTQRLYDGASLAQRRADAVSEQLAANAEVQGRIMLVQDVSRAYYDALLRETQLGLAHTDVARTNATATDLATRQAAGRALATDASTARIAASNARLALQLAASNRVLSKQHLFITLGLDTTGAAALRLADPLVKLLTIQGDTASWSAADPETPTRRPDYQQEQLREQLAAASLTTEQRGYRPTLALTGYLGAQGYDDKLLSTLNVPNWYGNSYVALQAAIPLLDGSARATRVAMQRMRTEQAHNRADDLRRQVAYEVSSAHVGLLNTWQILRVKWANVGVATKNGELVRLRQQAGRALPREVLDAETAQQQAQQDYLQAVYDFLVARLEYARATGMLGQ